MAIINMTPYTLLVYPGRAHWYKPIEDLCVSFCTLEEAENEKRIIERLRPKYYCEIVQDK